MFFQDFALACSLLQQTLSPNYQINESQFQYHSLHFCWNFLFVQVYVFLKPFKPVFSSSNRFYILKIFIETLDFILITIVFVVTLSRF